MKYVKWVVAAMLLLPISAFTLYKPIRVVIPEAFGLTCGGGNVCVDNPEKLDGAIRLVNDSKNFLQAQWGLSVGQPRLVFCSTPQCQGTFGHPATAGFTLGTFGVVIQPRGWKQYYVAHELVHCWQAETFGNLAVLNGKSWVIEGMAYTLSKDPRKELHEPFQSYRQKFTQWYSAHAGMPLKESIRQVL